VTADAAERSRTKHGESGDEKADVGVPYSCKEMDLSTRVSTSPSLKLKILPEGLIHPKKKPLRWHSYPREGFFQAWVEKRLDKLIYFCFHTKALDLHKIPQVQVFEFMIKG
jgi:hypothetical protein